MMVITAISLIPTYEAVMIHYNNANKKNHKIAKTMDYCGILSAKIVF